MTYPTNIPICIGTRTVSEMLKHRWTRVKNGFETPLEFLALCFDKAMQKYFKRNSRLRRKLFAKHMMKKMQSLGYVKSNHFDFKGIKIPMLDKKTNEDFFNAMFEDDYYIYLFENDNYEEKFMDKYYYLLIEGPFCFKNELVDVQVKPGDVVIDVGSWIGDFAAYASVKGATTYAFEPSNNLFQVLKKTASLNPNIIPVEKAVGNETISNSKIGGVFDTTANEKFDITTLDDFVSENKLTHVDFIKADIEGFERHMLEGAQETLKNFAPKLALCTYHLPDDPEILAKLIKKANPNYKIVQKRMKLFATV